MKNRIGSTPIASLNSATMLLAKNIMVFFDDTTEVNKTLKRIAIILDNVSRALIVDSSQEFGIIDVICLEDAYKNAMWVPKERIGLLRKLSVEKLLESGQISDAKIIKTIQVVEHADKSNDNTGIIASDVLELAIKVYLTRYPQAQTGGL
jgi:hypothetical protein